MIAGGCSCAVLLLSNIVSPIEYLAQEKPPGQNLYILSKLLGLIGIVGLLLQPVFWVSTKLFGVRSLVFVDKRFHMILGLSLLLVLLSHAGLFIAAVSTREGQLVLSPLSISFSHGYYKTRVSFGVIALILLVVMTVSGGFLARWSKNKAARYAHYLAVVCLPFAFLHALSIGTEVQMTLPKYAVISLLIVAVILIGLRVLSFNKRGETR